MEAVLDVLPAGTVVYADANAAWTAHDARLFVRATRHLDYVLEQPCADHDANVTVRAACDRPFVLDESIDSLAALLRVPPGRADRRRHVEDRPPRRRVAHPVGPRRGGRARALQVTVEDTGGAQVDTAAIAHLSLSTPVGARTHTVDFHNWVTVANGSGDLCASDGTMSAPTGPGLGIAVDRRQRSATPLRRRSMSRDDPRSDEVLDITTRMLRASGASPLQADATARSIRDAEADGIRTVGLSYLPTYCDHVACGKVVGDAVPIGDPAPPAHRGRRRRQRVLPSGVRSRADAARRGRPRLRRRRAGDQPLVLGRRARMVRRAARRATARRDDVRQLVVTDGARRRRASVLRHESDRVGRSPACTDRRSSPTCRRRPSRGCGCNAAAQAGETHPARLGARRRRPAHHRCAGGAGRFDGARRRPQGLGAGAARRSDVGRRGGLELLLRGVGLRRDRRWSSRRRPGGAGHRPDGDHGRRVRRPHRARAAGPVGRAGGAPARRPPAANTGGRRPATASKCPTI